MTRKGLVAVVVAASLTLAVSSAQAGSGERPRANENVIDLQIMENRLRGVNFHEQQQRLREQDRRAVGAPQPRPEIPVIRPGCASGAASSRFSTGC